MQSKTFMANNLEEAKKKMERWLSDHKVIVKNEHAPVEMRRPAGRFAPMVEGKVISVSIHIDYETSK